MDIKKMTKSGKFKRQMIGLLAGGCLVLAAAAPAFAEVPGQVEPSAGASVVRHHEAVSPIGPDAGNAVRRDSGNTASSVNSAIDGSGVSAARDGGVSPAYAGGGSDGYASEALREKHREIDEFLFKQHDGKFPDRGFTVTFTGPVDDRIEIGIAPYDEAHAEYLLELFGGELVRVVEGEQAVPLMAVQEPAAPDEPAAGMVTDGDTPVSSSPGMSAATAEDMPVVLVSDAADTGEIAAVAEMALAAAQPAEQPEQSPSGMTIALYALAVAAAALILFAFARTLRKR